MTARREGKSAAEGTQALRAAFDAACATAMVPACERARLWARVAARRTTATPEERVRTVLADWGHWRLYVAAREGDAAAGEAFRRYWLAAVRALCGSHVARDDVNELAAAFFARVLEAVTEEFTWDSSFRAYLKAVLVNLRRDHGEVSARRRQRETSLDQSDDDDDRSPSWASRLPSKERSVERVLLDDERAAVVRRAIAELSPGDRHVLLACLVDETSGDDVARALGIGRDAVYQRLHRARARLKVSLEASGVR